MSIVPTHGSWGKSTVLSLGDYTVVFRVGQVAVWDLVSKRQSKTELNSGCCFISGTDEGWVKTAGQTEPQAIQGIWPGKQPRHFWLMPECQSFGVKSIFLFSFCLDACPCLYVYQNIQWLRARCYGCLAYLWASIFHSQHVMTRAFNHWMSQLWVWQLQQSLLIGSVWGSRELIHEKH